MSQEVRRFTDQKDRMSPQVVFLVVGYFWGFVVLWRL